MARQTFQLLIALGLSFISLSQTFAADIAVKVEAAIGTGQFALGTGSDVSIDVGDPEISGASIFLAKAVSPDGKSAYQIYFNKDKQKVYYIKSSHFSNSTKQQPVLNPFAQAGGTCTGYAIYDFLQQTHLSGFKGNGVLASKLSDEMGRTTLLVDNINEYYLTPAHRYSIRGILDKYGKTMGFSCRPYSTDSYEKARNRILNQLATGSPVIISFNLGPNMYKMPFTPVMYDQKDVPMDDRLWIPRKKGEANRGGHTIVAASSFEFQNKTYLLVIDSDWSEPRVWDMDSFLNNKTVLSEVEMVTCKEKAL